VGEQQRASQRDQLNRDREGADQREPGTRAPQHDKAGDVRREGHRQRGDEDDGGRVAALDAAHRHRRSPR